MHQRGQSDPKGMAPSTEWPDIGIKGHGGTTSDQYMSSHPSFIQAVSVVHVAGSLITTIRTDKIETWIIKLDQDNILLKKYLENFSD